MRCTLMLAAAVDGDTEADDTEALGTAVVGTDMVGRLCHSRRRPWLQV